MEQPKPDNILSQPPERPPAEIQAHPPQSHNGDPPPSPDDDFRKRSAWEEFWVVYFSSASEVRMDTPKPDSIQSQPPQQSPAEIQAYAPPPRANPLPLLDYDFKKRTSRGLVAMLVFVAAGICVSVAVSFVGQTPNKTFTCTTWQPGQNQWAPPGWNGQGGQKTDDQ